jgi:competence protein ComEC
MTRVVEAHANSVFAERIPDPPDFLVALFVLTYLSALLLCGELRGIRQEEAILRRQRAQLTRRLARLDNFLREGTGKLRHPLAMRAAGALVLLIATATIACLFVYPFSPLTPPGELEISMIDVGQGDSFLLALPDGRVILLDTGGIPVFGGRKSSLDIGEDVVSPYLWSRRIRKLDALILSHADYDHAGSARAILRNFRPPTVLYAQPAPEKGFWQEMVHAARITGTELRRLGRGDGLDLGEVQIKVLHPARHIPASLNDNRYSLILRVEYGETSILLTGDSIASSETELLAKEEDLRADVLKVGHHGSKTSTTTAFLQRVDPSIGLLSAGWMNVYRHPHQKVTDLLESENVLVYRTDWHGMVRLFSDGRRWRSEVWQPPGSLALRLIGP